MAKYQVLIVPSADNEHLFERAKNFKEALKIANSPKGDHAAVEIFDFETENERKAFTQGYSAGIGYMGGGMFFLNTAAL